MEEKGTKKGIQ